MDSMLEALTGLTYVTAGMNAHFEACRQALMLRRILYEKAILRPADVVGIAESNIHGILRRS